MVEGTGAPAARAGDVVLSGLCFPEAPRWHDGRLFFSDVHAGRVLSLGEDGGDPDLVLAIAGTTSGLGWLPDGRALVVAMRDRRLLRLDADGPAVHADLSAIALHDVNDLVVDAEGRAYVGQVGFDFHGGGEPAPSPLLVVAPDGAVGIAAPDLLVANGMCLSDDGSTLLVAETLAHRITAFHVDDRGRLSQRRSFAALDPGDLPDGMCLDAAGAVWVACPGRGLALRVREGGEVTDAVAPRGIGRRILACALGDVDRCSLYLCTAGPRRGVPATVAARAGRIERVRVEVPGAGRP